MLARAWIPAFIGLCLTGCGAAPVSPIAAPPVAPGPAPNEIAAPESWQTIVLPAQIDPYLAAQDPDGTLDVIAGGMRMTVQGESVEFARDGTLAKIIAHARSGSRWLFATQDGVLYRAESFTGPLARVEGRADDVLSGSYDSEGVLATATASGRLWLGTGEAFRPAPPPLDGPLVDVGFVSETFGLAVVSPGVLYRTLDGGDHFERVDVGPDATYVVYPNPDGFVLGTTGGLYRVGPSGAATPYSGPTGQWTHDLPDEAVRTITEQTETRYPIGYAGIFASGALPLSDGRLARVEMDDVVVYDRQGGHRAVPFPTTTCESLQGWGPRMLTRCYSPQSGAYILYASDGHQGWTEMRTLVSSNEVIAAADGSTLVTLGACDNAGADVGVTPVCMYDGHDWQTLTLRGSAQVLSVLGDMVLYLTESEGSYLAPHRESLRFVRLSEGDGGPGHPLVLERGTAHPTELQLLPGGAVVGRAVKDRGRYAVFGSVEGGLSLRPLPPGEGLSLAFVDGTRAVAVGETMSEIWTTVDAGRSWQRLPLGVDGDVAHEPVTTLSHLNASQPWLQCSPTACRIGPQVIWSAPRAMGEFEASPVRVLTAEHPARSRPEPRRRDEGGFFTRVPALRCDRASGASASRGAADRSTRMPMVVPVARGATPSGVPIGRLFTSDGWIDAGAGGASDPLGGTFAPEWSGRDDRGRYHARGRSGALPPVGAPPDLRVNESVTRARMVSRTLGVLERCVGGMGGAYCDLLVTVQNAATQVIDSGRELFNGTAPGFIVLSAAAPLPDGGAALVLSLLRGLDNAHGLDLLLRLDAHGRIVARRGFAWGSEPATRMLGVSATGPVLVVQTLTARDRWTAYGLDPGDAGTLVSTGLAPTLPTCASAPDPGRLTVYAPGGETTDGVLFAEPSGGTVQLSADNTRVLVDVDTRRGSACLRGLSYWSVDPRDSRETTVLGLMGGVPRLRAVGGSLSGVLIGTSRDLPVRCSEQ